MPIKPCDEIAADTIAAQRVAEGKIGIECRLDINTVLIMVEEVSQRYEPEFDLEPILDRVLQMNLIAEEPQRTGYKCALGKIFNRRRQWNDHETDRLAEHFAATPFAPYEQDRY